MTDPIIVCPNCKTQIKLTESLAAPIVDATRKQYEKRIAEKDEEISGREASIRNQQADLEQAKSALEEQVVLRLTSERAKIIAEEARKAKQNAAPKSQRRPTKLLSFNRSSKNETKSSLKHRRPKPSWFADSGSSTTPSARWI